MSKRLVFDGEARAGILKGIDILGRAVETTYGYQGPCVMVQHRTQGLPPFFTRDGVTVANSVVLGDRLADLGARMLRDVANAVSREAGDGTTTAVVLARAIARGLLRSLAAGADPHRLREGMDAAVKVVEEDLRRRALPLQGDMAAQVAEVSMRKEGRVGRLLQQAYAEVGPDGAVTVAPGWTREDTLDIGEGFRYELGFLSPGFETDPVRRAADIEGARVLLYHGTVTDFMDLVPLLEAVNEAGQALVIACDGIDERPLQGLVMNVKRGVFRALAVKAPGHGDRRRDWLDDLATATGARVLVPERGDNLERAAPEVLGHAAKVVADADSASFIGCGGDPDAVARRVAGLGKEADAIRARKPGEGSPTGNLHDLEDLEARISALVGRIATVRVGGTTEPEIKERLQRAENARRSVRAALEEGVVPGGGVGLLQAREALGRLLLTDLDWQRGVAIVSEALEQPFRALVGNAGINPMAALARIETAGDARFGYEASSGAFGDLVAAGVLDPVKVLRLALAQAAGIAATVLSSGAVVLNEQSGLPHLPGFSAEWAAATREDPRA